MWLVRWSGLRHFDIDSLRTVPESAGLYLLWSKDSDGSLKCCWADHSDNLRLGLISYLNTAVSDNRRTVPGNTLMFEFALLPSSLLRQGAVRFLRRWYRIGGIFEEGILIPVNPPVREMYPPAPPGRSNGADTGLNSYLRSGVPRLPEPTKGNTLIA
ncbi:MAG: hypothetical protein ABIK43_00760 [candidate division WOR-3 bacterium]